MKITMLTRDQKKQIVKDLTQELESARSVVFSDFQGLPARDSQDLRASLRKDSVSHKVVKLTLLKLALKRAGVDTSELNFNVPLSVSISKDDEIAAAKLVSGFAKTHPALKILGGVMDKKLIDAAQVKALAALPGKQELYGQLVSVIAGPLRGFVTVLAGNLRGLVNVLNAIKATKA